MNISREKAEQVAKQLTKKIKDNFEALEGKKSQVLLDFIDSKTPENVRQFFIDNPKWQRKTHVRVYGVPHYETVYANWNGETITVDEDTSKVFMLLHNEQQNEGKKLHKLREEITQAMLAMKTYARCKDQFPEAYELLPKTSVSTALMVNLESIRETLSETN